MASDPSSAPSPTSHYNAYEGDADPPAYPGRDARTIESGGAPPARVEADGRQTGTNGEVRLSE